MSSIPTFAHFLHETSSLFSSYVADTNSSRVYHVILGNEAGDCDSIVSALALAYVYSMSSRASQEDLVLPICSVNREDMILRRETTLLLERCQVDTSRLLYLDDDSVKRLLHAGNFISTDTLRVTLTDHNAIRSSLNHLSGNVVGIIDHHADEGKHVEVINKSRDIAFDSTSNKALVGSACTLVAERLLQTGHSDDGVAMALLGTIVLDTMNMNVHAGKGTSRDQEAIDFLRTCLNGNLDGSINLDDLFNWLNDAKFDALFWDSLSARDALRIDYKRFESVSNHVYGISSVLLPIGDLLKKPSFDDIAFQFMKDKSIDLLVIMSMTVDDAGPKRGLLLFGKSQFVDEMTDYLTKNEVASFLEMESQTNGNASSGILGFKKEYIHQGNIKGSRKQVAPIMMQKPLPT